MELKVKRIGRIAQWFRDLRIRYKLVLVYALAGFLPVGIVLPLTFLQIRSGMLEQVKQHMRSSLYQASSAVDNQINIFTNLYHYITFDQSIANVLGYEYSSVYDMYQQLVTVVDPMIASMKYFHQNAKEVTIYLDRPMTRHADTLAPLSEIEETDWYQELDTTAGVQWFVDEAKRQVFCAGPMLRLAQIKTLGILTIHVSYDSLFEPYEKTKDSNYGILILDEKNRLVYEASFFEEKYLDCRLSSVELLDRYERDDREYEIVREISGTTGWSAYMYKPDRLLITSMTPALIIALMALSAFLLAALGAIYLLTHFLTKRVERLRSAMEQVREGNLELTIANDSRDEIGDLSAGFNDMLKRLSTLINEVYEGKIKEKEYEMKALQAQINPHFLYNTLSMINWKAIEAQAMDISRITLSLSTFYRTALNKGKNITTFRAEINNMRSYLEIELMMHDNSFDVEIDVDENILQYSTLNLLLQPLIENAIVHGIDVKTDGRGKIRITGREETDRIVVCVEDNGVGMDEEQARRILTEDSGGYGVRNVNERIRLYYGEEYALTIESAVGVGTRATIRIPKL